MSPPSQDPQPQSKIRGDAPDSRYTIYCNCCTLKQYGAPNTGMGEPYVIKKTVLTSGIAPSFSHYLVHSMPIDTVLRKSINIQICCIAILREVEAARPIFCSRLAFQG